MNVISVVLRGARQELMFWIRTAQASMFAGGLTGLIFQESITANVYMISSWALWGSLISGVFITLPASVISSVSAEIDAEEAASDDGEENDSS